MLITVKVSANSKINKLSWYDKSSETLKLQISAPPVDGKANKMIQKFLAKSFQLKKHQVKIKIGESSSLKTIILDGEESEIKKIIDNIE